jgi:hypothetical protein
LYQGSIAVLLRSLHTAEEADSRLLQTNEIRVGKGLESILRVVHAISDTIRHDDVAWELEGFDISLGLLERALNAGTESLRLYHKMAILRDPRQRREHCDIDMPPLNRDPLRRPTQGPQERNYEVSDEFILARRFAKGLAIFEKRHKISGLSHDTGEVVGDSWEPRILTWEIRKGLRLPSSWRRINESQREVHRI